MRWLVNKHICLWVLSAFVVYAAPIRVVAGEGIHSGRPTAAEAAALGASLEAGPPAAGELAVAGPIGFAQAPSDTTEFEFPGDKKSHLVRDVTVFVIASVFVAYFIIKVFLEGDTESPPPDSGNGKPTPQ